MNEKFLRLGFLDLYAILMRSFDRGAKRMAFNRKTNDSFYYSPLVEKGKSNATKRDLLFPRTILRHAVLFSRMLFFRVRPTKSDSRFQGRPRTIPRG